MNSMDRKQILLKVEYVFRTELDANNLQIEETTSIFDIEEWDSLAHILICNALEKEFNIHLSSHEILACDSVSSLIDAIIQKL
jgi:acyl carrier protein